MLVVNHYNYLPGSCTLCRSSNPPAIDTNVDLDWPNSPDDPNPSANRRLYICADCAINLADMVRESRGIELRPQNAYKALEELSQGLSNMNRELKGRVEELENTIAVIKSVNVTPIIPADEEPTVTNFKVVPPPKGAA